MCRNTDMLRTFNMGIGLIIICASGDADRVLELLEQSGEREASVIGRILAGGEGVTYVD